MECSVIGCTKPVKYLTYCQAHYSKHRRSVSPPCVVDGCSARQEADGLCNMHFKRRSRTGQLERVKLPDAHKILSFDDESVVCQTCGPVKTTRRRTATGKPLCPVWSRDYHRLKKYGLTPEQAQEFYDRADGCCELCGNELVEGLGTCLDHDHDTGVVRGVLCPRCNTALGLLRDDPSLMRRAASWVENFGP